MALLSCWFFPEERCENAAFFLAGPKKALKEGAGLPPGTRSSAAVSTVLTHQCSWLNLTTAILAFSSCILVPQLPNIVWASFSLLFASDIKNIMCGRGHHSVVKWLSLKLKINKLKYIYIKKRIQSGAWVLGVLTMPLFWHPPQRILQPELLSCSAVLRPLLQAPESLIPEDKTY